MKEKRRHPSWSSMARTGRNIISAIISINPSPKILTLSGVLLPGALQKIGAPLPDVNDIFKHVAATVGGGSFGIPRIPENRRPGDLPLNYLKVIWPNMVPVLQLYCDRASQWPILMGIAAQEGIAMTKDVVDPTLAASICDGMRRAHVQGRFA